MPAPTLDTQPIDDQNKALTVGDWLITLILVSIPFVGMLFILYWALSSTANINRKKFSIAFLFFLVGLFILSVVLVLIAEQVVWMIYGYVPGLHDLMPDFGAN